MRLLVFFAAIGLLAQNSEEEILARLAASASEAMQAGDFPAAEKRNRDILRLRPKLPEAKMNLGLSLYLQKRYEPAIQTFKEGLALNPGMANALLFIGICEFNLNHPSRAIPALRNFTRQSPGDLQGQYFLGLAHLALDHYAEAQEALIQAHSIDSQNIDVLYHLAQSYLGEARKEPAKLGLLSKRYEDAVNQIAAIDPNSFRIAQLRAGYHEATGKREEAIGELETLLQQDPKVRGLHYTLGCLYTERRQYDKALREFNSEMSLDVPYPRTYLQLGHVYLALDKPAEALPLLEKAIQVEPESAGTVWIDIGRAYRSLNEARKAASAFEKAITLGERNAAVYYQLSMAARSAGDSKRSREALEMSQRLRSEEKPKHLAPQ